MKHSTAILSIAVSSALFQCASAEIRGATRKLRDGGKGGKRKKEASEGGKGKKEEKESKGIKGKKGSKKAKDPFKSTKKLRKAVSLENIQSHLESFQRFADFSPGTRTAESDGYVLSGAYIAQLLEDAGYNVEKQSFIYTAFSLLGDSELKADGVPYTYLEDFATMAYSPFGRVEEVLAQRVDNLGCDFTDYGSFQAGSIAIIERGVCAFTQKAVNAEAAGAVGAVIFNDAERADSYGGTLGADTEISIPVLSSSYNVGLELVGKTVTMFSNSEVREGAETFNIIAESVHGSEDQVVMAGAHLDSVPEGPGIQDNGSGSTMLLEIALQMAHLDIRPKNKLRFAWWGAEESGGLGSIHYLQDLTTSSPEELAKIAIYLNFDMVASPNYVRFVYDAEIEGEEEVRKVFLDYFGYLDLSTELIAGQCRSDNCFFQLEGIPTGGLFTGAEDLKTEEQAEIYGGKAGEAFDPCYHLACDTIDNVNYEVLDVMSDATAHAIQTFADRETIDLTSGTSRRVEASKLLESEYRGPLLIK